MGNDKEQPGEATPEASIEELLSELPIKQEHKALLARVIGGIATNLAQANARLDSLERQPVAENAETYAGLTADQKYQVLMAKASGPAAQAQQGLLQALLSRAGGGGGDLAALAKSAESIQALRSILLPPATTLQIAMEKAQVSQLLAQTRLMNKVAGKATSTYLDRIEAELEGEGSGEGEV